MSSQLAGAVRRDGKRYDAAADRPDPGYILSESANVPVGASDDLRSPEGTSARRHGLIATELGFRISDVCMVAVAMWTAHVAGGAGAGHASLYAIQACIALVVTNLVFSVRGIYRDGANFLQRLGVQRLLAAWWLAFSGWLFSMLLLATVTELTGRTTTMLDGAVWFEPRQLTMFFFGGILFIMAGRLALMQVCALTAVREQVGQRTYIIGSGPAGLSLARHLAHRHDSDLKVLGFFDDGGPNPSRATIDGLPLLGGLNSLIALIHQGEVDTVLVATPWSAPERINGIMRRLASLPVSVGLLPEQIMFDFPHRMVRSATGLPILQVCEKRLSDCARVLKKLEDMVLAVVLLLITAPVMAAIAVAIKLDSPGPVLFSQPRYGIGNRIINVHKFRTMHAHLSDRDCEQQTVRGDPRLTRVGALLRRFSLDELPQLLNVLTGEMSIVGPRPHALSTKAEGRLFQDAVATYMARHRVKPGITGWAQVNGWRGETDTLEKISRRVEHDLYYIGNWSPALDLFILVRTIGAVLKTGNAY